MALIQYSDYGKEISDKDFSYPNCRIPLSKEISQLLQLTKIKYFSYLAAINLVTFKEITMKKIILICIVTVLICSNIYAKKVYPYKIELTGVELNNAPSGSIENKSNHFNLISPQYTDSLITMIWFLQLTHLTIELTNNSNQNYKIIWNEVTYIDTDNNSQRVLHSGRKIINKDDEQPPTTLVKKSKIVDCIIPMDNIEWYSSFNRWGFNYFFQKEDIQTIKILFPIEVNSKRHDYFFSFKVTRETTTKKTKFTSSYLQEYVD